MEKPLKKLMTKMHSSICSIRHISSELRMRWLPLTPGST